MLDKAKLSINRSKSCITFNYPGNISENEALELQKNAGYHPAGYDFYSFMVSNNKSTWLCSSSSD